LRSTAAITAYYVDPRTHYSDIPLHRSLQMLKAISMRTWHKLFLFISVGLLFAFLKLQMQTENVYFKLYLDLNNSAVIHFFLLILMYQFSQNMGNTGRILKKNMLACVFVKGQIKRSLGSISPSW
jgi:hypothetical protein